MAQDLMGKSLLGLKPVSPNELLHLQKTNKSEKDKPVIKNNEKQNIELPKQNKSPC